MSTRKSIIITKKKHGRLKNDQEENIIIINEKNENENEIEIENESNYENAENDLLHDLDHRFNSFITKIINAQSNNITSPCLHNRLLRYRQIFDDILKNGDENSGTNITSTATVPQLNRHYDVKNDINLINLSSINIDDHNEINENVSQILSDPGFISQVIHKTQTLNKYNIIIQDPSGEEPMIDDF